MNAWDSQWTNDTTVVALLRDCADAEGHAPFLDFSGVSYTYREVWDRATAYAAGLNDVGVGHEDTVVTMLDNSIDAVAMWFATNLVGAIWVPINTALKGNFLSHVVADSGARVMVCEADLVERVSDEAAQLPELKQIFVRGTPIGSATLHAGLTVSRLELLLGRVGEEQSFAGRSPQDTAIIIYTGGTTGPSKGCMVSNAYLFNAARAFLTQTARQRHEVNWSPLPAYHLNLVTGTILGTMLLRSSAAIAARFSVSGFWPEVERTGAVVVNLLGSMGSMIAQMAPTEAMDRCHGQIRMVHGAPFPPELVEMWQERFGITQVGGNTYGLTECFPLTTLEFGVEAPPGSSGRANSVDFDIRIFDEHDCELPVGEVGEVVCRPRRVGVMFSGYWRRPEAVAAVTQNLWYHTGDLGRFDDEGFFHFADRKKDYLRRRGENISSQEVEGAVLAHPAIAEVAVHAVPSEVTEDDVKITAVLTVGDTVTPLELFEWLTNRVPYFALPRYIEFREALPVSAVGRVFKYKLVEEGCTPTTWDRDNAGVSWERR